MNIFALDSDPIKSAQMQVDSHVVKMVLETAQLLSTAHRVLDGTMYIDASGLARPHGRKVKRWRLDDDRDQNLYSATHINHPSSVWCRFSNNNYTWLYVHFVGLCNEYTYRYGKIHKTAALGEWLQYPPRNIPVGYKTPVTPAMPKEYIVADSVQSYRNYYKQGKSHLHKWTNREVPLWMKCGCLA